MIATIAQTFCAELKATIGSRNLAEVVRRNRAAGDDGTCASHDFCDANMVMQDAFTKAVGREPDTGDDSDLDVWNRAWDLAKDADFDAQAVRVS